MTVSSYIVQKGARRASMIGGYLTQEDKAIANRRARHVVNQRLREQGEEFDDADLPLLTAWDVW